MKIVYKKTHDHICFECDNQFNWVQGVSIVYGKQEYKTIEERREIEKIFCSLDCFNKWKNN